MVMETEESKRERETVESKQKKDEQVQRRSSGGAEGQCGAKATEICEAMRRRAD